MFKTLALTVAIVLVLFVVVVLVLASRKPGTFRVQRQSSIAAPAARIYPLIADYRQWAAWSPYDKKDPAMRREFSGPASGTGARYAWASTVGGVGTGDMLITEATPHSAVHIALNFSKPFEGHNQVVFSLQPQGSGTLVTWDMQGPAPLMSRVMQVFFDMDTLVGKDFAAGLADLKAVAEKPGA